MSSKNTLQKAFDMLEDYDKVEKNKSLVMIAVEFDENGYPSSRAVKCIGTPGSVLASITILKDMIDGIQEDTLDRIDRMGEASENMMEILKDIGISDPNDPRIDMLFKSEEFFTLMKNFKRNFGK